MMSSMEMLPLCWMFFTFLRSLGNDNVGGVGGSEVSQSNTDLNPLTGGDQIAPMDSKLSDHDREPSNTQIVGSGNTQQQPEALNKKALDIVQRVRDKLTGKDFDPNECLDVADQVDLLIRQATNNENLCQCYIGWCPFW